MKFVTIGHVSYNLERLVWWAAWPIYEVEYDAVGQEHPKNGPDGNPIHTGEYRVAFLLLGDDNPTQLNPEGSAAFIEYAAQHLPSVMLRGGLREP